MILINLKIPVRPDRVAAWIPLAEQYARDVAAEEGCEFFEWSRSLADPNVFVTIECFRDADAGGAHMKTDHVAAFMASAPDYVAAQPQIIYIDSPQITGFAPMGEITPR
ncbi:MAG: putative quinol monooxygenase [Sporichthyaceae bacterium]